MEAAVERGELSSVLCDDPAGGMGVSEREAREGGDMCNLYLIHTVVQQKVTQHCKATILQIEKYPMRNHYEKEYITEFFCCTIGINNLVNQPYFNKNK